MAVRLAIGLVVGLALFVALERDSNRRVREGLEPPTGRASIELTPREQPIVGVASVASLAGLALTVTGRW
jgi:hypothetical protein